MLIDQLQEKLKSIEPDIVSITTFWEKSGTQEKFEKLDKQINCEDFWQNLDSTQILKEHQRLKLITEQYNLITNSYNDNEELLELFATNEAELGKIEPEIYSFCKKVAKFKIKLLLNKQEDASYCFLSINPGAGGTESQDWANILLRMYLRFCEREGFKVDILDYQSGDEAGIKSVTLFVKGSYAFGFLKCEAGIHRLVRISPFDSNKRRHTSFAAVTVIPEVEEAKTEINDKDLRIDTYRASGAGG